MLRNIVFVIVPLGAGVHLFRRCCPASRRRLELRIDPSGTADIGQAVWQDATICLSLVNPYREVEKEDPENFRQLVAEGGQVYIPELPVLPRRQARRQRPLCGRAQPDTAQFPGHRHHRAAAGIIPVLAHRDRRPGPAEEAAPWLSSMPVWQNFLSEDEIWKVILYLYDYTGHRPAFLGA